jgi:phosphoglycerate dehydrogenase-like enzyme
MTKRNVTVLNAGDCAGHLAALTGALPVALRLADFAVPWEEIAARRARRLGALSKATPEVRRALDGAEALFAFAPPSDVLDAAANLQWVETPATGFDQLNGTGLLERRDLLVTTVGGLFAPWVAEHAFALLLGLWRKLDLYSAAQRRGEWIGRGTEVRELRDATMAIVGLGNIGQAVARVAKAFGMRVIGSRRQVAEVPDGVDRVYGPADLHAMLGQADVVVLAVAGTAETVHLIGAAELAAMRPQSYLINVARGIVVDEMALADALRNGTIAGAGLDTFSTEPLPADSPLWRLPTALITPHIAVNVPSKMRRCVEHFADNLGRWCRGEPLRDLVVR